MIKRKNGTLHWLDLDITQSPWSVIRCPHCGYRIKLRGVYDDNCADLERLGLVYDFDFED